MAWAHTRLGLGAVGAAALLALAGGCSRTQLQPPPVTFEETVRAATVTLEPGRCAGAVVGGGDQVVTAAHCVQPGEQLLVLVLHDGRRVEAETLLVDRERDVAILGLGSPVTHQPLALADALPFPGSELLFAGRNDRLSGLQQARVERLGRCPSLPGVPQALFTSLDAKRGDSGAPLVDAQLQVQGLVHGGARCNIATPMAGVSAMLVRSTELLAARRASATTGVGGAGLPMEQSIPAAR